MAQQQIIRNVTTMDREAPARVTTDDVLKAVKNYPGKTFSTFDLAESMGVSEYPVRAAVSWLLKREVIEKVGEQKRFTARAHEAYWVIIYQVRVPGAEADFNALNRAFGFA